MRNAQEITILLHCWNLPGKQFGDKDDVRLGIQKGSVVIEDVPGDVTQATYAIPLRVKQNSPTGNPDFTGPFVHGAPGERFIYLCWGERKEGNWYGFRRAKVHLNHLDWNAVETAWQTGRPIQAFIEMTDEKGGPLCASVKADKIRWQRE
jgi:hypothetical protein